MRQVNIAEARVQFSRLVETAMLGEGVIIARDSKPATTDPTFAKCRVRRIC